MKKSSLVYICLSILTLVNLSFFSSPGLATSIDTNGTMVITCPADYLLISHKFSPFLGGTSNFKFIGACYISTSSSASNMPYNLTAKWTGNTKQAIEEIDFGNHTKGLIVSSCPDDPWINDVKCVPVSIQTGAYPVSQANRFPVSSGIFNAAQKAMYKLESDNAKRRRRIDNAQ